MTDHKKVGAVVNCPVCEAPAQYHGYSETLVGFFSPVGHDHNDNCKVHSYSCSNGHVWSERRQNTCPACDWKGKTKCFCHPLGIKIAQKKALLEKEGGK